MICLHEDTNLYPNPKFLTIFGLSFSVWFHPRNTEGKHTVINAQDSFLEDTSISGHSIHSLRWKQSFGMYFVAPDISWDEPRFKNLFLLEVNR